MSDTIKVVGIVGSLRRGSLNRVLLETAQAVAGFRASYEKVATEGGDYTMNHTASVFLFDAEGQFASTIDYHEQREFAVPKIRRVLAGTGEQTS